MDYPLDSDQIDQLIFALERAKFADFSLSESSPVNLLLEVATDLAIMLSEAYRFESFRQRPQRRTNDAIGFDYNRSDPLGNPLSFRKKLIAKQFERPPWDPNAEKFFQALAQALVLIRRSHDTLSSFMEKMVFDFLKIPPKASEERSKVKKKGHKQQSKSAVVAYHRRQRKRQKFH